MSNTTQPAGPTLAAALAYTRQHFAKWRGLAGFSILAIERAAPDMGEAWEVQVALHERRGRRYDGQARRPAGRDGARFTVWHEQDESGRPYVYGEW